MVFWRKGPQKKRTTKENKVKLRRLGKREKEIIIIIVIEKEVDRKEEKKVLEKIEKLKKVENKVVAWKKSKKKRRTKMLITKIEIGLIVLGISNILYRIFRGKLNVSIVEMADPYILISLVMIISVILLAIPKIIKVKLSVLEIGKKVIETIKVILNIIIILGGNNI